MSIMLKMLSLKDVHMASTFTSGNIKDMSFFKDEKLDRSYR
jgi:hypothetical protein